MAHQRHQMKIFDWIEAELRPRQCDSEEFFYNLYLEEIREKIVEVKKCRLTHPSGKTLSRWMKEIGFAQVKPTHNGGWFAYQLFGQLQEQDRPTDLASIDQLLEPLVKIIAEMEAPWTFRGGQNPMLTALK